MLFCNEIPDRRVGLSRSSPLSIAAPIRWPGPAALAALFVGAVLWIGLLALAEYRGLATLAGLAMFGAVALVLGALASLGRVSKQAITLVDGAAGGAMLTAALVFVVPHALMAHTPRGAIGLALGLGIGALLHRAARGAIDQMALTGLTLHTLTAGCALGALYSLVPALGVPAGLAILVHKAPAGYLLAHRLERAGRSRTLVAWPAIATGLGALPVAMMRGKLPVSSGLMFGIAAGLFLFVALGFVYDGRHAVAQRRGYRLAGLVVGTAIALAGWGLSNGG